MLQTVVESDEDDRAIASDLSLEAVPLVVRMVGHADASCAALESHLLNIATVIVDGRLLRRHSRPDVIEELRAELERLPVVDVAVRRVRLVLEELLSLCPHQVRLLEALDLDSQLVAWELPNKFHLLQQLFNVLVIAGEHIMRCCQADVHLAESVEHGVA